MADLESAVYEILAISTPIFILIGLGYVAVRGAMFSRADVRVLGGFVINFAVPAMLFKALSQRAFDEILNVNYLVAFAIGSLFAAATGLLMARHLQKRGFQSSVIVAMGCSMSNSAFIGFPVAVQVVGPIASVAMALSMLVENLLMLPLMLALADFASDRGKSALHTVLTTLGRLVRNPMIVAIALGFAVSLMDLKLPAPLLRAVDMLSLASGGIALFVIGGNLAGIVVKGMVPDVGMVAFGKLIIHPLAVMLPVLLFPGIDPSLQAAAVIFAGVPMLSIYPIIGQRYGMESLCAAAMVATTVISFITISLMIWLVTRIGLVAGVG